LVEIAQGRIVKEERVINLREPFRHGAVRGELLATFHEGADNVEAHFDRLGAVENIRRHERTVLGESVGTVTNVALRCGHKL